MPGSRSILGVCLVPSPFWRVYQEGGGYTRAGYTGGITVVWSIVGEGAGIPEEGWVGIPGGGYDLVYPTPMVLPSSNGH